MSETTDSLMEDATESLHALEDRLGDVERLDALGEDELESVLGDLDTLTQVVTEATELLEAADLSDLPEAIDVGELLEAIEIGEIPSAIEEGDVGDAVDFGKLFAAIDLMQAWNASDLASMWEETRELDDAVDELAADDDSVAGKAASALSDDEEGMFDDIGEDVQDAAMDVGADIEDTIASGSLFDDPEAYQVAIQQTAFEGIDAFRDALLETHGKFERLYEFNREKMRRQDTSTHSRNPTAASTIPTERLDLGGSTRYSTVPQQVKYSTAPSRRRIYGQRFEQERKKRHDTND